MDHKNVKRVKPRQNKKTRQYIITINNAKKQQFYENPLPETSPEVDEADQYFLSEKSFAGKRKNKKTPRIIVEPVHLFIGPLGI